VDSIVVEVPSAFKAAAVCFQQLLALAASACDHGQTDAPMPFADLERALTLGTGELQRALQGPILASMARDEPRLWIGDTLHVRVAPVTTTFHGLAGPVAVTRWRYRPADDPRAATVDPIALRVGAVRGTWLPATAEAMAFLVQQSPQREAERTAHLLHVLPYSDSSFHRVTQAMGARWAEHRDAIEEVLIARLRIPDEATGITVSLDRVATPMEEPRKRPCGRPPKGAAKRPVARVWRMSYCATVTLHDANGRSLHTLRYGAMPGCDPDTEVIVALQNDVAALRARRPDLQVGLLCDGAVEMWNLLHGRFTEALLETSLRELVDLWHLLQKVGKALRTRYSEARTASELRTWKLRLLNRSNAATALRDELRSWLEVPEDEPLGEGDPLNEAVGFLTRQLRADRLDYAAARRAGQPVGSGPVEASCKCVFNVRLKRSGARWKEASAGNVINLRATALSHRWDEAMELLHLAARKEVRRAA
jgi:hypothetical protein